jgi:cytoskeletal protein CcmA (bactofilin family)
MALFAKRRESATVPPTGGDGYSVLHANLTVVGDVETDGTIRIDGRLDGSVRRAGLVVLGAGASVRGNVAAREVIVGGAVHGNIVAAERVELQPSGAVTGDIEANAVLIHEGGAVRGRLCVRSREAEVAAIDSASRPKRLPAAVGDGA